MGMVFIGFTTNKAFGNTAVNSSRFAAGRKKNNIMIATVFSFCYITLICWCYGSALMQFITKLAKDQLPNLSFIIICFAGLASIGLFFSVLWFFIPMGTILSQIILVAAPSYWICFKKVKLSGFIKGFKEVFSSYNTVSKIALSSCILLILLMHSWTVNHPDTLHYHAQNIQWTEKYRITPGLSNLHLMYGLQSSWFVLCALFSFKFAAGTALTFVNAATLIWFVLFVIKKIAGYSAQDSNTRTIYGFLWLALLIAGFWSYSQIRLSASSGSPDFITALYIFLVVYLLVGNNISSSSSLYLLLMFFAFFAITIKLQALPLPVLPLYYYYRYDKSKISAKLLLSGGICLLVIGPFFIRNLITSGYILFPSLYPDFFSFDWKVRKDYLAIFEAYITAYARARVNFSFDISTYSMKPGEWLPVWWRLQSVADKFILLSVPVLLVLNIFFVKNMMAKKNRFLVSCLVLLIPGILFWFIKAPDPRFGFGFLLSFTGVLSYSLAREIGLTLNRRWLIICQLLFSMVLLGYSSYRFANYFTSSNILQPAGIAKVPYVIRDCNGTKINVPTGNLLCGDTPLPCLSIPCNSIQRGKRLQDGFRLKRPY